MFTKNDCNLLSGLDKSLDALKILRKKSLEIGCILGSIENLPIKSNSIDTIIMSQVVQWILRKDLAFSEVYRILKPDGVIVLNTLSHKQLSNMILMKYFPEIYQIELKRFTEINILTNLMISHNFKIISIDNVKETRIYNLDQLVGFVEARASSALRIYARSIGESEFQKKIKIYHEVLKKNYPEGPIIEDHEYTLIICEKREA